MQSNVVQKKERRRMGYSRHGVGVLLALVAMIVSGCGRGERDSVAGPQDPLPETIVVDVNGVRLDRSHAEMEATVRLRSLQQTVRPDQRAQLEQEIRRRIAQQFIARTLLTQEAARRGIVASPEAIEQAYDAIRSQLPPGQTLESMMERHPERALKMKDDVVSGILINKLLNSLPEKATVTEEDMAAFYEGIRRARHILVRVDKDVDAEGRAEKKAKAETIRRAIVSGEESFESMARRHSDCPSAQKGGDLGHFPRGQMVPAFDRAAFSQAVGEVGPLVETDFGYHIIQVMDTEITESGALAPEHVRREIMRTKQSQGMDAFVDQLKASAEIRVAPDFSGR